VDHALVAAGLGLDLVGGEGAHDRGEVLAGADPAARSLRPADAEASALRKSQVGSGDRSEKIRTYNFPQSRVTDHRVNVTIHQLDTFMQGQIEPILEPLRAAYEAERLKQLG
jgi:protein subunit release factor A